jgi:cytochrome c-type biogenesis protein CcmF
VMEAYVFPYINILWLGCLVMAFGTFIAIVERVRKLKHTAKRQ